MADNNGTIATDEEKIKFLHSCSDHKLFNFLLDDLELSEGTGPKNQITVRWTRMHPWEIVMNTELFAKKWGRASFHSLSRTLNQLSSVRIGPYCLLKRQSIGLYRFFGGYDGMSLPTVPTEELRSPPKKKRKALEEPQMNVTPKRIAVPSMGGYPGMAPMGGHHPIATQRFIPQQNGNPFSSFSPGEFLHTLPMAPRAPHSSVFMSPQTPGAMRMGLHESTSISHFPHLPPPPSSLQMLIPNSASLAASPLASNDDTNLNERAIGMVGK